MSSQKEQSNQFPQDELEFHPRWVVPFYTAFSRYFFEKSDEEQTQLAQKVDLALKELTDESFIKMLNHFDWRTRSAAGWLIGLGKKSQFVAQINANLLKYPRHATMYCFTLNRIGGQEAIKGLSAYLDQHLQPAYFKVLSANRMESVSANEAIVALERLDTNKVHLSNYYPNRWNDFVKGYQTEYGYYDDEIAEIWSLDRTREMFVVWEAFAERYFPNISA